MTSKPSSPSTLEEITKGLTTKAAKIRALADAGYSRTEISKLLNIRYQQVRNALVRSGSDTGGNTKTNKPTKTEKKESPHVIQNTRDTHFSWENLLKSGFSYIGDWVIDDDNALTIDGKVPTAPGVYALIHEDNVVYVGLTLNGLRTRMNQYRRGYKGQKTSSRVNGLIRETLSKGDRIKVLIAQPDPLEWNGLPVNTPAGLEAGLIDLIRPPWNIQGT